MSVYHSQANKRPSEKYSPKNIIKDLEQAGSVHSIGSSVPLNKYHPPSSFSLPLPRRGRDHQGVFNNAQNFVVNNPVFAESIHLHGTWNNQLSTVLHLPARCSISGTGMDFSSWHSTFLCHPCNHQAFITRVNPWNQVCSCQHPNKFWPYGPAELSKSAIARRLAHPSHVPRYSSTTVSRLGGQYDIYKILPILLYFAVRSPSYYQAAVSQILTNGPKTLGNLAVLIQFQKSFVEPLRISPSRIVALFLCMCIAIIFGISKGVGK